MQYIRAVVGDTLIEFYNSIWGEETVKVNGQEVSRQKSIMGAQHFFTLTENGEEARYVVVSKVLGNLSPAIDIFRNGVAVCINLEVVEANKHDNPLKKKGLRLLNDYRLNEALEALIKAGDLDRLDAEIPLYMACVYSLKEDAVNGFACLLSARKKNLSDISVIDTHDMLAFLRLHPAFEAFRASGYTTYDLSAQ